MAATRQTEARKFLASLSYRVAMRVLMPASKTTCRRGAPYVFAPEAERMRFDVSGIDHLRLCRSTTRGEFTKQPLPYPAFRPPHKPIVNRCWRPVFRRAIAPPAAALDHVHDATDHAAIIYSGFAPHVLRQKRLDLPPLFVAPPKQIASHHLPPNLDGRESATDSASNIFIGFGP